MQVIEHLVHFRFIFFSIFFLSVFCCKSFAQTYPDRSVHLMLRTGIDLIINQKYDEAEKVFSNLENIRKDLPLGKVYLAAVMIARAYDFQTEYDDIRITSYLNSAKKISERLLNDEPKISGINIFMH